MEGAFLWTRPPARSDFSGLPVTLVLAYGTRGDPPRRTDYQEDRVPFVGRRISALERKNDRLWSPMFDEAGFERETEGLDRNCQGRLGVLGGQGGHASRGGTGTQASVVAAHGC